MGSAGVAGAEQRQHRVSGAAGIVGGEWGWHGVSWGGRG